MNFRLRIANPAKNQLRRLDRSLQRRIVARFDQLCAGPLSSPLSDWVEGTDGLRKTRVGSWRILYYVDTNERRIEIRAIRPRGQAYRGL
ncbi:MAG: type II toxin-antitoxin system RelE/ParE family toxin [Acidobacteria bacterium]|nr:type II toxin-antitoxin system RelE/ParE family toxin [Acidobacteriota bacterium]